MLRTMKNPLVYSDEFKTAVIKAYPDNIIVQKMVNNSEYLLGKYLDTNALSTISVDVVLGMLENGEVNCLFDMVADIKEKSKLYALWDKEVFVD